MENGAILVIVLVGLVVLGGVFVLTTTGSRDRADALRRRDPGSPPEEEALVGARPGDGQGAPGTTAVTGRAVERAASTERASAGLAPGSAAPPAVRGPLDAEAYGVTRRQFFNRGIIAMFTLGTAGFGTMTIAFLWPSLTGGFGSKIRAGELSEILAEIADKKEPFYVPEGRFYLNPYPKGDIAKAKGAYTGEVLGGMEGGLVALYQKCVHLGCRVPWCKTAQWFECPCHGSQYNRVGEHKAGPAPRGLDRFGVDISGGTVSVDTKAVVQGPPIGTNTTGQEAEGPHCV